MREECRGSLAGYSVHIPVTLLFETSSKTSCMVHPYVDDSSRVMSLQLRVYSYS
jgi:hypothetical protein